MGTARILIVEDEVITATTIKNNLKYSGYEIVGIAFTGEQALSDVERARPDLVLMDIKLRSDLDGIAVAGEIQDRYGIPVVFLTAYTDDDTIRRAREVAPYGYISKPFTERDLVSNIEIALYKYQSERKLRESEDKYRSLFENLIDAFSYHRVIYDDNKQPVDYEFIEVNPTWERIFQISEKNISGKRLFKLVPGIKELEPVLLELFSRTVMSGESSQTELYFKPLKRWFNISLYSPKSEFLVVLYHDITDQRELEREVMNISQNERQRFGHDLHDGLGQNLTGIAYLIEALRQEMEEKSYPEVDKISRIAKVVDASIDHTRSLARGLSPVNMEKNGLVSALEEMAQNIRTVFGVTCKIEEKGRFLIEDVQTATHLYYIAQESINNAIKHGRAQNVGIELTANGNGLQMKIHNDGSAVKSKNGTRKGIGLRIMEYRARMIGAEFEANTCNGEFFIAVRLK